MPGPFDGKTAGPIPLSANGRVWFLVTVEQYNGRHGLAIEARDEAHAVRRISRSLADLGATVAGCTPMTRELWAFVDSSYPLPEARKP